MRLLPTAWPPVDSPRSTLARRANDHYLPREMVGMAVIDRLLVLTWRTFRRVMSLFDPSRGPSRTITPLWGYLVSTPTP